MPRRNPIVNLFYALSGRHQQAFSLGGEQCHTHRSRAPHRARFDLIPACKPTRIRTMAQGVGPSCSAHSGRAKRNQQASRREPNRVLFSHPFLGDVPDRHRRHRMCASSCSQLISRDFGSPRSSSPDRRGTRRPIRAEDQGSCHPGRFHVRWWCGARITLEFDLRLLQQLRRRQLGKLVRLRPAS